MIILEVFISAILTGFRNSVILYLQCSKIDTKTVNQVIPWTQTSFEVRGNTVKSNFWKKEYLCPV